MGFTNSPYGVTSFGIPIFGNGIPWTGSSASYFFVDPANGSDSNPGTDPAHAFDTINAAYAKCTSGKGDTVILLGDGATTGTARDTAITWAKNNTHLIGMSAPTMVGKRSRIAPASGVTDVDAYTPYITLSATGCILANISIFQGNSEDGKASVGLYVSGNRNYIYNVDVQTGAHANQGDENTYNLQLTGDENTFERCVFGVDSVPWTGDTGKYPANIRLGSGAADEVQKNVFKSCICQMYADNARCFFVYVQDTMLTDIQKWNLWENCYFFNYGTTLTGGVNVPGSSTGYLLFANCGFYGCTDVTAADNVLVQMLGPTPGTPVDCGMFKSTDIT